MSLKPVKFATALAAIELVISTAQWFVFGLGVACLIDKTVVQHFVPAKPTCTCNRIGNCPCGSACQCANPGRCNAQTCPTPRRTPTDLGPTYGDQPK